MEIYQKVFDKRKVILGSEHPDTLTTQSNMALVLSNQGKYKEALENYNEIYEMQKRPDVLGPDHPSTLITRNNMAVVLSNQGEYMKAYNVFKEVYEIQKRPDVLGPDHPDALNILNNMAGALDKQGKYKEALKIYKKVYEKREEFLGPEHPDTLTTQNDMAVVLDNQGKYQEALEIYQKVFDKRKVILGSEHPDTLTTQNNIAAVLFKQDKYEEAYIIFKEVYQLWERKLGPNHPNTLSVHNNMALVRFKQGKYDEALQIYQKVYEVQKRPDVLGPSHPDTLATLQNSIEILKKKHEPFSAEKCLPGTSSESSGRRKREAKIGECELSWDDVDKFNEEKEEARDFSKIKINSDRFINYVKSESMSESKLAQLVQLADKVQVTGKFQGLVNKLISNQKIMNHLNRVGRVSGIAMHGMMGKTAITDFLNGDYTGVAINVGFIAGGQGFARVAQAASIKGTGLVLDGKLLLGRSLKAASPFLARGTSAFVVYDLVNQVKEFKNGTEEALVSVIGDGIYLGVDAAEIGIEIAEAFEVFEGVSSITGPIGAAIGAVIFVGTDIYLAVKRVDKINEIIHLTGNERFFEGLRAFIGMQPEQYIEELMEEKQVNNQLVK